jgi:2-(1,2-epoxy-1,2-dihydrophenyl)acetyl-CoA isomerase
MTIPRRVLDTGTNDVLAHIEDDGVGVVVLNRPERRNALSRPMLEGLAQSLGDLEESPDVGAVVLTGASGAFSAGGDVKAFAEQGGAGGRAGTVDERIQQQRAMQHATVGRLRAMSTPTIASLPGAAAGAGLGLALACDLRVGCARTVITTAFGKVGLSGDYGTAWLLNAIVGPSRARRLMFVSERLTGAEAHAQGLLDWLVADEDLESTTLDIARSIAAGPRDAHAAMKANLLDAATHDLASAMDIEVVRHLRCAASDEHREAVQAFVEKRAPRFGERSDPTARTS